MALREVGLVHNHVAASAAADIRWLHGQMKDSPPLVGSAAAGSQW